MINWEKTQIGDGKNNTAWYTKINDNEFEVYIDLENDAVIWRLNIIPEHVNGNEKKETYSFISEQVAKQYVEKLYKVQPKVGDKVERKWGHYEILKIGDGYQVKKLVFNPGGALSYQKHFKRKEIWVVVQGNGMFKTEEMQHTPDYWSETYSNNTFKSYLFPPFHKFNTTFNSFNRAKAVGDVISIEVEQLHKFTAGSEGATIIETWLGICDEDDIERVEE